MEGGKGSLLVLVIVEKPSFEEKTRFLLPRFLLTKFGKRV